MYQRKGFSIIELLVVIGIMAVLITMLIPPLGKAKEHAKHAVCLANMKALISAWIIYTDEYSDHIVPSGTYSVNQWVYAPWPPPAFLNDNLRADLIMAGQLWPYVESLESYHCPSDPTAHLCSYSIQNSLNGDPWWAQETSSPLVKKLTSIHQPDSVFVFLDEGDSREFNYGTWVVYTQSDKWIDPVTAWHLNSTSFAFADGRAQSHRWLDDRTLRIAHEQLFYQITPENMDLDWLRYGYKIIHNGK